MKSETASSILLILSVLLLGIIATVPGPSLRASGPGTTIQVWNSTDYFSSDIVDDSLTFGSRFNMDILATNLPPIIDPSNGGINGFTITINYNSTVLKAVDASHRAPLCPASDNCLFDRSSALVLASHVDDPPGTTSLSVVLVPGTVDGSGVLFRITFEVTGTGFTVLQIDPASTITGPVNGDAQPIPYKPVNGRFENRKPFRLDTNPTYASILAGHDAVYNIDVTQVWKIQNFTENISFGISGLPGDALATFSPTTGTLNFSTQLTITTTTNTIPGTYQITITGISDVTLSNTRVTTDVTMVVATRDVAVVRVSPTPTNVAVGDDVTIAVDVKNNGNQIETIDLNINANGTAIFTIPSITLSPSELQTITRVWATGGSTLGAYTMSADIPPFVEDSNPNNNILIDGIVHIGSDFAISLLGQNSGNLIQGQTLNISVDVTLISIVPQPELVSLSLTGAGPGLTFDFTPAANAPTFASTLTLTASATATSGTFNLAVEATGAAFTRTAPFALTILVAHDLAVVTVSSSPVVVNPSGTATIQATVRNNGALQENFTVTIQAVPSTGSPITVGSAPVTNLQPGLTIIVSVTWTTPATGSGMYTFTANIAPVTGEQNTGDNTMTGGGTRVNAPPTASFSPSLGSYESGSQISFDASASSDADGSITTYAWDFGDGATATGKTPSHRYSSKGTYEVTLTVTDNNGSTATIKHAIAVTEPPADLATFLSSPTGLGIIIAIIVGLIAIVVLVRRRKPKTSQVKPTPTPKK